MDRWKYDENGKFIVFDVSKEKPCPICQAEVNYAHTNYCPNSRHPEQINRLSIKGVGVIKGNSKNGLV